MLKGYLTYKGLYSFIFTADPVFGSCKFFFKPLTMETAAFVEDIPTELWFSADKSKTAPYADRFAEDFANCRYRFDVTTNAKVSTTFQNKTFAAELAVAIAAAQSAVKQKHSKGSKGEYCSVWTDSVGNADGITAALSFKLGLLSSGIIRTENLDLTFLDDTDNIPMPEIVFEGTDDTIETREKVEFTETGLLKNLVAECNERPVFGNLAKQAEYLYTLCKHYVKTIPSLEAIMPKRTGYMLVKFSQNSNYAGEKLIKAKVATSDVSLNAIYPTIEAVRAAHPNKVTEWIEDCDYKIVTDEMLPQVMAELRAATVISFDTETTGLKINFYSREGLADELVGVCLSAKEGTGYYFPLQHKLFKNLCNGDHRYFMQHYMKELLEKADIPREEGESDEKYQERLKKRRTIVCHNLAYDWKVAYIYDINVQCDFDTMLAFGVTKRYEFINYQIGLKALCSELFGIDMFDIEDFIVADWKNTNVTFADLPYDLVEHYGPADADITLRLYRWCTTNHFSSISTKQEENENKKANKKGTKNGTTKDNTEDKSAVLDLDLLSYYDAHAVFAMEVEFAKVVAYSEFYGYHIDVSQLGDLEAEILAGRERECKKMFEIAGKEFNPNSTPQLCTIIYDELGIPMTQEGKRSTSKDILKEMADIKDMDGKPLYPFVVHLLEYRKYDSTYKNFLKKKDIYISPEGYVFPGVMQLGADTGRCSVTNPNYQSYNDVVKKRVNGRPGFYIYDCDFAQIEYRVLASMADELALKEAFKDPDLDYHQHQAARMFSLPYASVTKALRQQSKGINFGLPYGMGDESLGKRVFGARTKENTAKAADLRKRFFDGQDNILNFFETVRNDGVKHGYTKTKFGRRRYYHKGVFSEAAIRRQAGNHVIQGTAADIWKLAVTRFFNCVVKKGWLGKVLFDCFIHDELMGEVSVDINPYEFINAWRENYEVKIENFCDLYAGFGWGRHWYEAKKADYPPQFIELLCQRWGTEQSDAWDKDFVKLIEQTKVDLYNFETWRVKDWLEHSPEGTLLAPHIGNYMYAKVADWWGSFEEKHPELIAETPVDNIGAINKKLKSMPLDEVWHLFAEHEGIEYKDGWILPPDTVVKSEDKAESKAESKSKGTDKVNDDELEMRESEAMRYNMIAQQVYTLGFNLDSVYNVLYLRGTTAERDNAFMDAYCVPITDKRADFALIFLYFDEEGRVTPKATEMGVSVDNMTAVNNYCRQVYLVNSNQTR